jgi:hypothetical protein
MDSKEQAGALEAAWRMMEKKGPHYPTCTLMLDPDTTGECDCGYVAIHLLVLRGADLARPAPAASAAPNPSTPEAGNPVDLEAMERYYTAETVPPCRVCGKALTIQACGGSEPTEWGCDAAEGADDHFRKSLFIQRKRGDSDVLALIAEARCLRSRTPGGEAGGREFWISKWVSRSASAGPDGIAVTEDPSVLIVPPHPQSYSIERIRVREVVEPPPAGLGLPDMEVMAEAVHEAYLTTCKKLGWDVKPANRVPYSELTDDSKELDRASVRAVLAFTEPQSPALPREALDKLWNLGEEICAEHCEPLDSGSESHCSWCKQVRDIRATLKGDPANG